MSKRDSTEYFGQGQSGYTAGRVEGDPSLHLEARNAAPKSDENADSDERDHIDDDRWRGRGGVQWAPEQVEELEEGLAAEEDKPLVEKKVADVSRSVDDARR
jgi:hypothetical protein